MEDLTGYSTHELSLRTFNDEGLYNMRHDSDLLDMLTELFIFTDEQREELERDLLEDQDDD